MSRKKWNFETKFHPLARFGSIVTPKAQRMGFAFDKTPKEAVQPADYPLTNLASHSGHFSVALSETALKRMSAGSDKRQGLRQTSPPPLRTAESRLSASLYS